MAVEAPFLIGENATINGSVITLTGALADHFAASGRITDGATVGIAFREPSQDTKGAWKATYNATAGAFTKSVDLIAGGSDTFAADAAIEVYVSFIPSEYLPLDGGTLTGPLAAPSMTIDGELLSAAMIALFNANLPLELTSQTPTSGNVSAVIGKSYVFDMSIMTADVQIVLPQPQSTNDRIALYVAAGNADFLLKVSGDTGVRFFDQIAAEDDRFRYYTTGESATFVPNASLDGWVIPRHLDGRIPGAVRIEGDGSTAQTYSASSWVDHGNMPTLAFNTGFTVVTGDPGDPAAPTPSTVAPRRRMNLTGSANYASNKNPVTDGTNVKVQVYDYTSAIAFNSDNRAMGAATRCVMTFPFDYKDVSPGDAIGVRFQGENDLGVAPWNTQHLVVKEQLA